MSDLPANSSESALPGFVYTFYSYKGGVGRSMALANVGVALAMQGHRVLMVDWDLEAPGLEQYFKSPMRIVSGDANTPGVADLLESRASAQELAWQSCIQRAEFMGVSLDLISAGKRDETYRHRVQHMDWKRLYEVHRIGNFIEQLRDAWRSAYDFVLIDSRTGVSDVGDVCTVLLPDALVLVFVTNEQNLDGVKTALARARRVHAKLPVDRSRLLAVPLLSRDERKSEYEQSLVWQKRFADEFGPSFSDWLPSGVSAGDALSVLYLPYVPGLSFGERLPLLENERERLDPGSLGIAYTRLATLLAHRLDWRAIAESTASETDLAMARQELLAAREALRETEELAQHQREQTRLQAERAALEQAREREQATQDVREASRQRRRGDRLVPLFLVLLLLLLAFLFWTSWRDRTVREAQVSAAERLNATDPSARAELAAELGRQVSGGTERRSALAQLLRDPEPIVRRAALMAWVQSGLSPMDDVTAFRLLLQDPDSQLRQDLIGTVGLQGTNAEAFAPTLLELFQHQEAATRAAAVTSLSKIGARFQAHSSAVLTLLTDSSPAVRAAAATAVSRLERAGADHYASVSVLRADADPAVRAATAETLGAMGQLPEVATFLRDSDPVIRARAAQSLGKLGEDAARYAPEIAQLLQDRVASVRARAVEALLELGPAGARHTQQIANLVNDPDWQVRLRAVTALGSIRGPASVRVQALSKAVGDSNPMVSREASQALELLRKAGR